MDRVSEQKSPIEQAVDLFFYAPLGLVMNASELIPQLAEKGRQQAKLARMFGRYTVNKGQTKAAKAVNLVQQQFAGAQVVVPTPLRSVTGAERASAPKPGAPATKGGARAEPVANDPSAE